MPSTAGRPQSPEPGFSRSETAACPGRRATAAVRCRIVCPQVYARRATAGIVQMGPQADAPCLGRGHLLSMNALIEICGSRNGMRAPGGRPSVVPASRSGGHLKETRCAAASIQRG
jgi:hypothetical protein